MTADTMTRQQPVATKRRRNVRKVIVFLLVFIALLVAADFGVAAAAEYQVSKKMRAQMGLTDDPAVTIHGFPFVLQALSGDYPNVEINAGGVQVGVLRNVQINATLYDARIPLSDVLSGSPTSVHIDKIEGQVRVTAADVNRAFNATGIGQVLNISNLTISPTSLDALTDAEGNPIQKAEDTTPQDPTKAALRLSFGLALAGKQVKVTAYGMLTLVDTQIQVQPTRLEVTDNLTTIKLPDDIQRTLMNALSSKLDPGKVLPLKVTPTSVSVEDNALIMNGKAVDVTLGGKSQ